MYYQTLLFRHLPLTLENLLQFSTLHLDLPLSLVVQNTLVRLPVRLGIQLGQIVLGAIVNAVLLAWPHKGHVPLDVAIRSGPTGRLQTDSVVHPVVFLYPATKSLPANNNTNRLECGSLPVAPQLISGDRPFRACYDFDDVGKIFKCNAAAHSRKINSPTPPHSTRWNHSRYTWKAQPPANVKTLRMRHYRPRDGSAEFSATNLLISACKFAICGHHTRKTLPLLLLLLLKMMDGRWCI